ncbi:hypothetical protein COHA_007360 [Chlorella ohadii]|uniref:RecQ mediated genome instability protein 1 OB-fold domain-containing protein n=1 Tax=Chlorella ohadii TaxID=2649997 RepID=A0AAD5H3J8_9CHLO|nr:hypothetical protein COHA_007360 [Chlorella ohadii]
MARNTMAAALGRLRDEGWSLDEQAATELLVAECSSAQPSLQQALAVLLDADLKQVAAPCLPDDINRADSKKVAGPLVLQVSAVSDISQPSRASGDTERKGRILRLKLTDGRSSCVGIEFAPLPYSLEQLCPGTKVRLHNVTVRLGVLLLEPKAIEVLGGRVEALAEGWEVQQKYGGTATERTAGATATGHSLVLARWA